MWYHLSEQIGKKTLWIKKDHYFKASEVTKVLPCIEREDYFVSHISFVRRRLTWLHNKVVDLRRC